MPFRSGGDAEHVFGWHCGTYRSPLEDEDVGWLGDVRSRWALVHHLHRDTGTAGAPISVVPHAGDLIGPVGHVRGLPYHVPSGRGQSPRANLRVVKAASGDQEVDGSHGRTTGCGGDRAAPETVAPPVGTRMLVAGSGPLVRSLLLRRASNPSPVAARAKRRLTTRRRSSIAAIGLVSPQPPHGAPDSIVHMDRDGLASSNGPCGVDGHASDGVGAIGKSGRVEAPDPSVGEPCGRNGCAWSATATADREMDCRGRRTRSVPAATRYRPSLTSVPSPGRTSLVDGGGTDMFLAALPRRQRTKLVPWLPCHTRAMPNPSREAADSTAPWSTKGW